MAIKHEPAECSPHCTDELCPYMHSESWLVTPDDGAPPERFYMQHLAQAYHKRHLLPEPDSVATETQR